MGARCGARPVNSLSHGVARGAGMAGKISGETHDAVGAGATASAGNGNLGGKTPATQHAGARRNAVFTDIDNGGER